MSAPTNPLCSEPASEGFVLTHILTVADVKRSGDFYSHILGGTIVRVGEPSVIQLADNWIIVNVGGGPTGDKPTVTLHTPENPDEATSFMNVRVADIHVLRRVARAGRNVPDGAQGARH